MRDNAFEGPDAVLGVRELRASGFEPVEEYTGALLIAELWPEEHRRSVPETRAAMLATAPELGGRLWVVRPPWPDWTLEQTFSAMWRSLEPPEGRYDIEYLLFGAADFLRWDEADALTWRVDERPADH